jgi:hypothetical protein
MISILIRLVIAAVSWYVFIFISSLVGGGNSIPATRFSAVMVSMTAGTLLYITAGVPTVGAVIVAALGMAAEFALISRHAEKYESTEDEEERKAEENKLMLLSSFNAILFAIFVVRFFVHYNILQ